MTEKPRLYETIVVEGRDDAAVVKQVVDADVVITHGFGLSQRARERIVKAAELRDAGGRGGVVVLTDPDFAGEQIRKQVDRIVSGAIHVRLHREDATKNGDIGVENADPEVVRAAFRRSGLLRDDEGHVCKQNENESSPPTPASEIQVRSSKKLSTVIHRDVDNSGRTTDPLKTEISPSDLLRLGLAGSGSKALKIKVCRTLGLGDCNTKRFLERLRLKGVNLEQLEALVDNSVDK